MQSVAEKNNARAFIVPDLRLRHRAIVRKRVLARNRRVRRGAGQKTQKYIVLTTEIVAELSETHIVGKIVWNYIHVSHLENEFKMDHRP